MGKQIGSYVLGEVIGMGQYGKVYKGYDKEKKREVAVKAISRD